MLLPTISPLHLGWPYLLASTVVGFVLLLKPGYQLFRHQEGCRAATLFDHASYYPMAQLAIMSIFVIIK